MCFALKKGKIEMLPIRVSEVVVEPHEQLDSVHGELPAVLGVHDARVRIRCIYRAGTAIPVSKS